jgi:PAS domain S-box-containing protein
MDLNLNAPPLLPYTDEDRLKSLIRILKLQSETTSGLLGEVLNEVIALTRSQIGYLFRYSEVKREFVLNTWSKNVMAECAVAQPQSCFELDKTGIWGEVVRQGRPLVINNFEEENSLKKGYPQGHVHVKRFMSIPVFNEGTIEAVIGLANKETDYTSTDVLELQFLMDSIWKVIALRHAFEREERLSKVLMGIRQINHLIVQSDNVDIMYQEVCDTLVAKMDYQSAWIIPLNRQPGFTGIISAGHLNLQNSVLKSGNEFLPACLKNADKKSQYMSTSEPDKQCFDCPVRQLFDTNNGLCIPINYGREVYAMLGIAWSRNYVAAGQEAQLLEEIAGDLGAFIKKQQIENQRIKALDDLNATEKRFRMVLDNMPILLNAFDENNLFIFWNKACEVSTGYTADEIIGNPLAMEMMYPSQDYLSHVWDSSISPDTIENTYELIAKNGSKRIVTWFDVYHKVKIPGWASWGLGLDITEQRAAEVRAEAGNKLKEAFMQNISHEVRTPLAVIMGMGDMLANENMLMQERKIHLHKVKKNANRLLQTITDYMDASLVTSGNLQLNPVRFSLNEVLKDIFSRFRIDCAEKDLTLKLDLPFSGAEVFLYTDKDFLIKTLNHLLGNALKFTHHGGISFGYSVVNNQLEIFVRDSGVGIATDKLEMIFDAFNQEDVKLSRGHEGSGLGLTIARGVMNKMGGSIKVYSQKYNGSEFRCRLPHFELEIDTSPQPPPQAPKKRSAKPLALVAEDEEANLEYLVLALQLLGFEVITARNGKQAVEMAEKNPGIEVILMDIKMPVMNGAEASGIIRKMQPDLPIIAVTAYALSGDEAKMLEAGCSDYISKPFGKDDLEGKLKRWQLI